MIQECKREASACFLLVVPSSRFTSINRSLGRSFFLYSRTIPCMLPKTADKVKFDRKIRRYAVGIIILEVSAEMHYLRL